jgi:hypothetical protein
MATRLMTLGRANRQAGSTTVVGQGTIPLDMEGVLRYELDVSPPQRTDPNRWVRYSFQYEKDGDWVDYMVDEWRGHPTITGPALGDIEVHQPLSGIVLRGKTMRLTFQVLGTVAVNMGGILDHLSYAEWYAIEGS